MAPHPPHRDMDAIPLAVDNLARCARMRHSQREWHRWKREFQTLKQQHAAVTLPARLHAFPLSTWAHLTKKEKWTKKTVLLLLHMNQYCRETNPTDGGESIDLLIDLPDLLTEAKFESHCPHDALIQDRDVLFARLNTRQSHVYYAEQAMQWVRQAATSPPSHSTNAATATPARVTTDSTVPPVAAVTHKRKGRKLPSHEVMLTVPSTLVSDPLVWSYIVERHASLLLSPTLALSPFAATIPDAQWTNGSFLEATWTGIRHCLSTTHQHRYPVTLSLFHAALARFAPSLRHDATVVRPLVQVWSVEGQSCRVPHALFELIRLWLKPSQGGGGGDVSFHGTLLRNDTAFAKFVIDVVPSLPSNALKAFSKRLQHDHDFVMAVVTKNGACLQFAPYQFRRSLVMCQAACDSDPRALVYSRATKLRKDPMRVAQYFQAVGSTYDTSERRAAWECRLYTDLSAPGRENLDVCEAVVQAGIMSVSELPPSVQSNFEFWKRLLATCPDDWFQLPVDTTWCWTDLAHALETIPTVELAQDVFLRCPALFLDRTVWLTIVTSPDFAENAYDFLEIAPHMVWHDQEIMIQAIRQNYDILELLHDYPLYEDRDVLAAALECGEPEVFYELNAWVQVSHPDLVAQAIRTCTVDSIWDIYDCIEDPLWQDPQVVYAWLSRGGDFLHEDFLPEIANDEQAFLLIAQHNPEDFCYASIDLCTNKEYLAQVLEVNPTLLRELPRPRQAHDFDLALVALGGSETSVTPTSAVVQRQRRDLVGLYDVNDPEDFAFWTDFAARVHEQVASHDRFVTLILGGMTKSEQCQGSYLGMLDQGDETSLVYKKLLAEFSGVPTGSRLKVLRCAAANLIRWGY